MAVTADRVELRGLRVLAICGALPEEKERRQPFAIDVDVETSLAAAGASDELADTIDYGELTDRIVTAVTTQEFTLLERFAQVVADVVLADPRVDAVVVSVAKERPPVPHHLTTSGVRIRRERS